MSGHDHGPVKAPIPHVLPLMVYWGVFGVLIGLTVVTVAVAQVDLGPANLPVAIAIAVVKASLVAAVFMHLWFDHKQYALVLVASLLFLGIFIVLTWADLGTRDYVDPIKRNYGPRDNAVQQYIAEHPDDQDHRYLRPGLKNAKKDAELGKKLIDVDKHKAAADAPKGETAH
jgi:caa(3)-type oxidase subunit IV